MWMVSYTEEGSLRKAAPTTASRIFLDAVRMTSPKGRQRKKRQQRGTEVAEEHRGKAGTDRSGKCGRLARKFLEE
jgi:hypothetical protein